MGDHQDIAAGTGGAGPAASADPPDRGRRFGTVAEAYAAYRPDYPDTAVDWALAPLMARASERELELLDLAAGTGKLTAALVRRSSRVTAVEPDPDMLAVLRAALAPPAGPVRALRGTAEGIPLPAASVDAVLVGQAFHWFDPERAGREIARVLRPGGVLAALWNAEDGSVDWVAGYHEAASVHRRVPGVPAGGDRADLPRMTYFTPTARAEFRHTRRVTVAGIVGELGTHSWALLSTPEERAEVFAQVQDYLTGPCGPVKGADGVFELPLRTAVFRAERLPEPVGERDAEPRAAGSPAARPPGPPAERDAERR
jgi:SAM-dependent methyltransferase